jgi:hypothetical protein
MGNRPYDYGYRTYVPTKRTQIQKLCLELDNAKYNRNAARIALENSQARFEQAVIAVDEYNAAQEKCSCAPTCPTCGKEKE